MSAFEYKVVPAPKRGLKARGVRGTQARFANALELIMNDLGRDGWEYQRTDTLPCEERAGLTGKTTTFQNMLVFRRAVPDTADLKPQLLEVHAPVLAAPAAEPVTGNETEALVAEPEETAAATPELAAADTLPPNRHSPPRVIEDYDPKRVAATLAANDRAKGSHAAE